MIGRLIRAIWHRADALGSWRRKAAARLRHGRAVRFGAGVWIGKGVLFDLHGTGSIVIGARTSIWQGAVLGARGGRLEIGEDALVNTGCVIVATSTITIGAGALIAEHVTIRDQDHAHDDPARPYWQQGRSEAPIAIGANVWLGAKVTVTKGVTVPDDCIVGANSVVTRSIAEAGKYAGSPARRIGDLPGR